MIKYFVLANLLTGGFFYWLLNGPGGWQ